MLVEVMDNCSMEEFATRLAGSLKGLLSLALRVFRMVFENKMIEYLCPRK